MASMGFARDDSPPTSSKRSRAFAPEQLGQRAQDEVQNGTIPATQTLLPALARVVLATILFSFVGPVVKLVTMDTGAISFYRALFSTSFMGAFLLAVEHASVRRGMKRAVALKRGDWLQLAGIGVLLAGNWYFSVLAIQASNVAVAVATLFTYPLLTALLEPVLFNEPFRTWDLVGGVLVLAGVLVIVERFSWHGTNAVGAACGLASALCFALRNLLSRHALTRLGIYEASLGQFLVATLCLAPIALTAPVWPSLPDLAWLILLGGVLTTAALVLFTGALSTTGASLASLVASLQPILATCIAWLMLDERPSQRTLAGGGIILAAVLLSLLMRRAAS